MLKNFETLLFCEKIVLSRFTIGSYNKQIKTFHYKVSSLFCRWSCSMWSWLMLSFGLCDHNLFCEDVSEYGKLHVSKERHCLNVNLWVCCYYWAIKTLIIVKMGQARSRGLVGSWPRGPGFKPPTMETIYQAPFIWIKAWNKICGKTLNWHYCLCCNPANGRVDFGEGLAYKIQLHWMNCRLVRRLRPKSIKKK